jgi:hypothetical protein
MSVTSLHVVALTTARSEPIVGFRPKQAFRLRVPKCTRRKRIHCFRIGTHGHMTEDAPYSPPERDPLEMEQNLVWYQFDTVLKGFAGGLPHAP